MLPRMSLPCCLKPLPLAVWEPPVPASPCTVGPKKTGAPLRFARTWAPTSLPRLAYVTVARRLGRGRSGGQVVPAPEMGAALRLATRIRAGRRLVIAEGLKGGCEHRTPHRDGGPGSDRVSGGPETRPQPTMARLFRASCLLSLLLAGFVPPSRGQEHSKVSEPPRRGAGDRA